MTELKDIVRYGSDQDVIENLNKVALKLASYSELVPRAPLNDYQGLAVKRLLEYQSKETKAIVSCFRKDIHEFSWRVRNIFEGALLLEYVMKNDSNAAAFIAQKIGDERTILEGIASLSKVVLSDSHPIKERISKANSVLAKHGFGKASTLTTKFLANAVGFTSEYEAFYKLYSKYVHPSAWTILSDSDEYDTTQYWEVFLIQAQLHSQHALGCGERFLLSRGEFK